jgi:hypothetical protein
MSTTTGYQEETLVERLYDWAFKLLLNTWLVLILVSMIVWHASILTIAAMFVGVIVFEHVCVHLMNYGLHRRTPEDRWEEEYNSSIHSRNKLNAWATFNWMIGRKRRALEQIDLADWAWLDAQITLSEKDDYINGTWYE